MGQCTNVFYDVEHIPCTKLAFRPFHSGPLQLELLLIPAMFYDVEHSLCTKDGLWAFHSGLSLSLNSQTHPVFYDVAHNLFTKGLYLCHAFEII